MARIVVAGGGPAGLRAAEVAAEHSSAEVILLDANRYAGRKFLVAGKSGLNLTNAEPMDQFRSRFSGPACSWQKILMEFDNEALRQWARTLGFETFESAGGKVFPQPMKAGPMLRAWLNKLQQLGVEFRYHQRVTRVTTGKVQLAGGETLTCDAVILALGGASWPRTGSDGNWLEFLSAAGIQISPLQPANCGWRVDWPEDFLQLAEGLPLKNIEATTETVSRAGELVVTRYGLEGGPVYHLGPTLRKQSDPVLYLDLKPDLSLQQVRQALGSVTKNYTREAGRRLKLSEVATGLLKTMPNLGPWKESDTLAEAIKHLPIPLLGPGPMEDAISTAGGVAWQELDQHLMLNKIPGVFLAGEMIDWEAPTGGYLLQGCFATGQWAAKGAIQYSSRAGRVR